MGIVAGKVNGETVGRSDGQNLDLNSVDSKPLDYQDCDVVVRIDERNCGITYVANVKSVNCYVGAGDECQSSSKRGDGEGGMRRECRCDLFEIARKPFGDTETMLEVLDKRNCLLHVWHVPAAFRADTMHESGKIRHIIDSKLHRQDGLRTCKGSTTKPKSA